MDQAISREKEATTENNASSSDRVDELAENLKDLKILPEVSVQTTCGDEVDPDENEVGYETLIQQIKDKLASQEAVKEEILQPVLQSFDLEGVAAFIKNGKAKKIVVMCGAGISVSAGIPDFRSPKTGLYSNLQKYNLPHPQAVFELNYFKKNPEPFYLLAKELFPGNFKPSPAHYFMALLHNKGLLLRCFTQNIDSLEKQAGLPADLVVAAHGNFDTAHCISCKAEVSLEAVKAAVDSGRVCKCSTCRGLVKPDIVFFGEGLSETFFTRSQSDFPAADLLLVMGTSLVVNPFASLIDHVGKEVPRLLINRERVGEPDATLLLLGLAEGFQFDKQHRDVLYLGDCDDGVRKLCVALGWESDLDELIRAGSNHRNPL